jgi:hypothetical protein
MKGPPGGDFRSEGPNLSVSADGTIVDFGFEKFGKSPLRFDVTALKLSDRGQVNPVDKGTRPPRQDGLRMLRTSLPRS